MTEITISSSDELAEVIAERFRDGVLLSIFIDERSEENSGDESDEKDV